MGWLLGGLVLYVTYRKTEQKPLLRRVTIPERALRHETLEPEFGSILVPIFGTPLDDDIVQTAGRLAGETRDDVDRGRGGDRGDLGVRDAAVAAARRAAAGRPDQRAREALARAKAVGEEYEGVEVATAIVRARRAGQAIVSEAKRTGRRGDRAGRRGALAGARRVAARRRAARSRTTSGDMTKYVINKAPCRVILTPRRPTGRCEVQVASPTARSDGPTDLMAERRLPGLQRVLGVNALFSTAYGNVGSSIYYALGLVASFALGLTPIVFMSPA